MGDLCVGGDGYGVVRLWKGCGSVETSLHEI